MEGENPIMKAIDVGMICIKTFGKEAGKKCVVMDMIDKNFSIVTGPKEVTGIKRRRVSIKHLLLTGEAVDVKEGMSDEELVSVLKKSGKLEFMKSKGIEKK